MKKSIITIFVIITFLYCVLPKVMADSPTPTLSQEQIFSLFRSVAFVGNLNFTVPTVVETQLNNVNEQSVAVREVETNSRQPVVFISKTSSTPYTIAVKSSQSNASELNDKNDATYVEFPVNTSLASNDIALKFHYGSPISTSQLDFTLDKNVYVPEYIEIFVYQNGQRITVLSKQKMTGNILQFPQYSASEFEVVFYYSQPLRIAEISFKEFQPSYSSRYLRFLARPGFSYQIYKDADTSVPYQYVLEAGNLYEPDLNTRLLENVVFVTNPIYIPADQDRDGVYDSQDNCINTPNKDQIDVNSNRLGDACEDFDVDGVINAVDNCPDKPNNLQQDKDSDGKGDHCDDEESRLVERWKFLPWLGIAFGFGVVILLFKFTLQHEEKDDQMVGTSSESKNLQTK